MCWPAPATCGRADHRLFFAATASTKYPGHQLPTSLGCVIHAACPAPLLPSLQSLRINITWKLYIHIFYMCIYTYSYRIKLSEMTARCTHVMVVNTGRYSWRRRVGFQQRRPQIRRNLNKRFCDWKSNLPYTNFLFYRPSFFGSASWFWAQARSRLGSGYSFMLNGLYL